MPCERAARKRALLTKHALRRCFAADFVLVLLRLRGLYRQNRLITL